MPRSLDPSSRLTLVLACDVDKPADTQPRLFAKCLTGRQELEVARLLSAIRKTEEIDDRLSLAHEAAEVCLSGWENMVNPNTGDAIPFSAEAIHEILCTEEMIEAVTFVMSATKTTPADKKKSE